MVTRSKTFARIAHNATILSGEPVIVGTRLPVHAVILTHRYAPDAEYIYSAYPFVARANIDEAIAYYGTHRDEIDQYIAVNEDDENG